MHDTDRRVWAPDGGECEDSCFVACDAVCSDIKLSTLRINVYLFLGYKYVPIRDKLVRI
jgi:hypothetical protein